MKVDVRIGRDRTTVSLDDSEVIGNKHYSSLTFASLSLWKCEILQFMSHEANECIAVGHLPVDG